jgi:lysine 6-dehydrogenase
MKKIAVLGCGLIGSVIARDLARDPDLEVEVFDRSERSLAKLEGAARISRRTADLATRAGVAAAVAAADVVVGAVPGFLGRRMLETVLDSGKSIADISFAPEDPLELDAKARQSGAVAIVDCGVSPGLSNFAAGRAASKLDEIETLKIYVGGLPAERRWPWEYGIVFSATDVIEEYTRPARIRQDGRIVVRPALSETELVNIPPIGTLEGFLTDGLRTLLSTVPARNMMEKTLRYPGHAERMRALSETGFFREEPIEVDGVAVSPRRLSETLLFRAWKMEPGAEEFTVLRVVAEGRRGRAGARLIFDLFDRTDAAAGITSMARTTGFPCAVVARLLARGELPGAGVRALEHLGRDGWIHDRIVQELSTRKVEWSERLEEIP